MRSATAEADKQGLSPRVRGNPRRSVNTRNMKGSIPASAGEPQQLAIVSRSVVVYPRECGGTVRERRLGGHLGGLSPRVRGNLEDLLDAVRVRGSIPASAGEPVCDRLGGRDYMVYPRECGGTKE